MKEFSVLVSVFALVCGAYFSGYYVAEQKIVTKYTQEVIKIKEDFRKKQEELQITIEKNKKEKVHNETCDTVRIFKLRTNCRLR